LEDTAGASFNAQAVQARIDSVRLHISNLGVHLPGVSVMEQPVIDSKDAEVTNVGPVEASPCSIMLLHF
jgi:hypothetical protein